MHYIVDPGVPDAGGKLAIKRSGEQDLEYSLITPATGARTVNTRPYQAPESSEQGVAGDARPVIGERTVDVIVEGSDAADAHAKLAELTAAVGADQPFTLTYLGMSFECVGGRGVTAWQPLGSSKALRVTIAYYPQHQHGTVDDTSATVVGPL